VQQQNQQLLALLQTLAQAKEQPFPSTINTTLGAAIGGRVFRPKIQPPPKFNGEIGAALEVWKREIESQFEYYANFTINTEDDKLKFAAVHLGDAAKTWWNSIREEANITTYAAFRDALNARYRPVLASNQARTQLLALRQGAKQSVSEYINSFQTLMAHIPDMGNADQVHQFVRGLAPHVGQRVREQSPTTLPSAISYAVMYEGSLGSGAASYHLPTAPTVTGPSHAGTAMDLGVTTSESTNTEEPSPAAPAAISMADVVKPKKDAPGGAKRLPGTRLEGIARETIVERKAANKCFKCGEEGHWKNECKNPISNSKK
jgi:hypothetical protein